MIFGGDRFIWYTQCDPACVHYLGDKTCAAFPDGIPEEIRNGLYYHTKPYPGDHGIQFELKPEFEKAADKSKPDKKLIRFQLPANPTAEEIDELVEWIKTEASNAKPSKKED